jgi:hypothetical protein
MDGKTPNYNFPNLKMMMDNIIEQAEELKKQSGIAIQRVQDNIREGSCIICYKEFKVDGLVINKCCGSALCNECGYVMQQLADRFNKKGTCANCRASISVNDLICIDSSFNLEAILNSNLDESDSEEEKEEKVEEEIVEETTVTAEFLIEPFNKECMKPLSEWKKHIAEYEEKNKDKERDKYTNIIDILFGLKVANSNRIDINIQNITQGANYMPEASVRKVLIFANYGETLRNAIDVLHKNGIVYWYLQGGPSLISNIALSFTECTQPCARVVNSTQHCSGLNLQTATDIVFMHKILDNNIETQVIGRGHRLGRTAPLNVWFNLYKDEAEDFKNRYHVRNMDDEELEEEKDYENGKKIHSINNVTEENEDEPKKGKKKTRGKKAEESESDEEPEPKKKTRGKKAEESELDEEPEPKKSKAYKKRPRKIADSDDATKKIAEELLNGTEVYGTIQEIDDEQFRKMKGGDSDEDNSDLSIDDD